MTPHRQSDFPFFSLPNCQTLDDTVSPPSSPPLQALQEKVESLQRRLHASEKKLFSKELEGEEKVTQPARAEAAPSETHFRLFFFFRCRGTAAVVSRRIVLTSTPPE